MIRNRRLAVKKSRRPRPSAALEVAGIGLVLITLLNPAGLLQDEEGLTVNALQRHCRIEAEGRTQRLRDPKFQEWLLESAKPTLLLTALAHADKV